MAKIEKPLVAEEVADTASTTMGSPARGTVPDPATMTEGELRAYVLQLQESVEVLGRAARMNDPHKVWQPGEQVEVDVPLGPGRVPLSINGKPYSGRMKLDVETLHELMFMLSRANEVEAQRMQFRGNMAPIAILNHGDVASLTNRRGADA